MKPPTERAIHFEVVGKIVICVHRVGGHEAEFDEAVDMMNDLPGDLRILVARGGPNAPSPLQRSAINEVFERRDVRIALMSSRRVIRGIVTVFNWLGTADVRAFPEHQLDDALRFLRATADRREVERVIARLCAELDGRIGAVA